MKLYFLGGSFDPPHLGHLRIAEYFSQQCDLFLFIPAQKSPFKKNNPIASPAQRIEMLTFLSDKVKNSQIETFESCPAVENCEACGFHETELHPIL